MDREGSGQRLHRSRDEPQSSEQLSRPRDFWVSEKACEGEPVTSVPSRGAMHALSAPGWLRADGPAEASMGPGPGRRKAGLLAL